MQQSRIKSGNQQKVMRLATHEFIRRFLIHVLLRAKSPAHEPLQVAEVLPLTLHEPYPDCGGPMRIIEIFRRGQKPMTHVPPQEQAA
jgi:hypothetical protein